MRCVPFLVNSRARQLPWFATLRLRVVISDIARQVAAESRRNSASKCVGSQGKMEGARWLRSRADGSDTWYGRPVTSLTQIHKET